MPMPLEERVRGNKLRKLFRRLGTGWRTPLKKNYRRVGTRGQFYSVPGEKVPAAGNKLEKFRVMAVAVLGERSAERFEECRTTNLTALRNFDVERYP